MGEYYSPAKYTTNNTVSSVRPIFELLSIANGGSSHCCEYIKETLVITTLDPVQGWTIIELPDLSHLSSPG